MSKDPAFLFYTNDFLTGIQDLTFEERGQYITLLCLQHQKGHLSEKIIKLSVGNAAADVMAKFRQDSAGLWYNERLEKEAEKRAAHAEKQKQRAIDGWKKRKNEEINTPEESPGNAAVLPLEDENVNEDVNSNKKKEVSLWPSFDDFWNKYDKKVGKPNSLKFWKKVSQADREKIMVHLNLYTLTEKKFRKDPERYLKNETWNDEVVLGGAPDSSGSKKEAPILFYTPGKRLGDD